MTEAREIDHVLYRGLLSALDNIVGGGAEMEYHCDKAEHDNDGGTCIWCDARRALALHEFMNADTNP